MPSLLAVRSLTGWDIGGAIVIAPILILVSLPFLRRIAERDRSLYRFLVLALVVKIGAAFIRYFVIADFYGRGDALGYDAEGARIADSFAAGNFDHGLESTVGTNFINYLTGIIYWIIGRTILGTFVLFAWFAYVGHLLWFVAFRRSVPEADSRRFGRILFFFPSLLFWPASIGKEAWMALGIGLAVYGMARAMSRGLFVGFALHGLGLWAMAMARPHMAILLTIASFIAFAIGKARPRIRAAAPLAKVAAIGGILVLGSLFAARAQSFFGLEGLNEDSVIGLFEETQRRSSQGGSQFETSIVRSPVGIPFATASVLFRPLPFEAHNAFALATAAESGFLALLVIRRRRHLIRAVRLFRQRAFLIFCMLYVAGFSTAFASVGNFGILARQRTLMLPAFLALLYVSLPRRTSPPQPVRTIHADEPAPVTTR